MKKKKQILTFALSFVALTSFALNACGGSSTKKISFYVDDNVIQVVESKGNEKIVLPEATEKEGYYFVGWFYNDKQFYGNEYSSSALTENISVYAQYKKYIHVTYVMNGGAYKGTGVAGELPDGDLPDEYLKEGQELIHGDTVISKDDYAFGGWYTSATFEDDTKINMPYYPSNDVTLYARWSEAEVTLPNTMRLRYQYSEYNDVIQGYVLYHYQGTDKEIDIPASYNGVPIVEIASSVFQFNTNITSVITHNNLKVINEKAFMNCSSLKTLVLADTIENIKDDAFGYCMALDDITFGKGLKEVSLSSFLPTQWYYNQPQGSIYINNIYYFYKTGSGDFIKELTIKEGTAFIARRALADSAKLKTVTLPSTLKAIGDYAFFNCTKLQEINFPEGLERIYARAFSKTGLTNISLPSSLKEIKGSAFNYCKSLKTVTFAKGMNANFEYDVFSNTIIEEVDIPEGVTDFMSAFSDCTTLTKMTIRSKTAIEFYSMPDSLKTIYVLKELLQQYKELNSSYADRFFEIA